MVIDLQFPENDNIQFNHSLNLEEFFQSKKRNDQKEFNFNEDKSMKGTKFFPNSASTNGIKVTNGIHPMNGIIVSMILIKNGKDLLVKIITL